MATKTNLVLSVSACAIIAAVCAVEGGFVDNRNDPGGATNHGITEPVARAHGYAGDMRQLPQQFATGILYEDYVLKPGFAPLVDLSPALAEEVVDSAVNIGPDKPSRWFQTALSVLGHPVTADGKVGPGTIQAYKDLVQQRGSAVACRLMIKSMDAQQGSYYLQISQTNPKLQAFTAGWLTNRVGNVALSRCG